MNQLLSQINNCKDEATCLNGNFLPNGNQIIIAAIDGGEIKLVTGQTLKQKNACTGNSSCTNDGLNLIEIGPEGSVSGNVSVRAGIAQDISETNECESSFCSTTASNSAVIGSTSTSSFVRQSNVVKNVVESEDNKPARVVQSSDQNNQCSGGASCTSTASNSINTGSSSDLEQSSDQNNQCSGGASCTSTASNSINTGSSSDLEQSSDQSNQCSGGASCTSTASNLINTGSSSDVEQSIDQTNQCSGGASCTSTCFQFNQFSTNK